MVSGTRDNPPPETTLATVYMWKRFPYRPSQSWPRIIIQDPYWIIKGADQSLFRWVSLGHSIAVGLSKLISLIWYKFLL